MFWNPQGGLREPWLAKIQGIRGGRYGTRCTRLWFGFSNLETPNPGPEFLFSWCLVCFPTEDVASQLSEGKGDLRSNARNQNAISVDVSVWRVEAFWSLGKLDFCNPCIASEFLLPYLCLHARQKVRMCSVSEICTHSDGNFPNSMKIYSVQLPRLIPIRPR